jgi:hypothetical protein
MLSVAADGKSLAAAANGLGAREIRIFSLPGLLPSHVIEVPYMVLMALSADGGTIAVATALDRLTFYATASGKPAATLPLPANRWAKPLSALDYSPDGSNLAAGFANGGRVEAPGPDGTLAVVPNPFPTEPVILWHVVHGLPQGTPTKLCGRQPDGVEDLLWLPKGRGVVITDQNGSAKLCPLDGAQAQTISAGTSSAIAIPALSADGRELAIGVNGQINLYELRPDEQG